MKDVYLVNYSVKGIKSIDEFVDLSFYKKTIGKNTNFKDYNLKAIYGENGSGKSGIITSLRILKELIVNPDYLNNHIIQRQLSELINKELSSVHFSVEFYVAFDDSPTLYNYAVLLEKDIGERYYIKEESLSERNARSHNRQMKSVFVVEDGIITQMDEGSFCDCVKEKTKNLLKDSALSAVFMKRIMPDIEEIDEVNSALLAVVALYIFGCSIYTYLDSEDEHEEYIMSDMMAHQISYIDRIIKEHVQHNLSRGKDVLLHAIHPGVMTVQKEKIGIYEKQVTGLVRFIRIFKPQLKDITIQKRDNGSFWNCELEMMYDTYSINSEFESTGIKKLIKLYSYIQKVVNGDIVFIDELDSNLHDVYLCALLEYLMAYAEGQLCFTTHNIGPMDVLKKNKKSIDFLSTEQKIYPWVSNGNYSPSKLYREGMIEGSPFNVDSTDFIGVFESV